MTLPHSIVLIMSEDHDKCTITWLRKPFPNT